MVKSKQLVIFGTQEMAQLAHFYFEHDSAYRVAAFTVDDAYLQEQELKGLPVVPWSEVPSRYPPGEYELFVALSYRRLNALRAEKFAQAKSDGYRLASYLCSKSVTWPDLVIGENCFVLENQTIQPTCRLGDNVYLWSGNQWPRRRARPLRRRLVAGIPRGGRRVAPPGRRVPRSEAIGLLNLALRHRQAR
jgi:hypothetical protein